MKFVKFTSEHLGLLEAYFNNPDTPINNNSHKSFKTHLYNDEDGILGILIDRNEIVAVSSAIVINDNGIKSCKYPHRLHIRRGYSSISSKFIDYQWDPMLFDWLKEHNICNLYCTFNIDNPKAFLWAAKRHSRRIAHIDHLNNFGKQLLTKPWYAYSKVIDEMNTPQYLLYTSPTGEWFYPWRNETIMPITMIDNLNATFDYQLNRGWII